MPRHSPLTLISLELSQVIYLEILKSKGTSAPLHSEEIGIVVVRLDARARYAILKNRKSNNAHCLGQRAGCCSLKRTATSSQIAKRFEVIVALPQSGEENGNGPDSLRL